MTRLRSILLAIAAATMAFAIAGPAAAAVKVGVLHCTVSPSIGFLIGGHQKLRCHFTPQYPGQPAGNYVGAINTVGLDIGVTAGGVLAWAVYAPTAGPFAGALAGVYFGASADVASAWDSAPTSSSADPPEPSPCSRFRSRERSPWT
jgi:hypothetical protein